MQKGQFGAEISLYNIMLFMIFPSFSEFLSILINWIINLHIRPSDESTKSKFKFAYTF